MWEDIKAWFKRSETIFWARLQVAVGSLWSVLIVTDLSPLLTNPKIMAAWLIFSGFVTEMARRRNANL